MMSVITLNDTSFSLPSGWNQLSFPMLMKISALSSVNCSLHDFTVKLFLFITSLKVLQKPEVILNEETLFYLASKSGKVFLVSSSDLIQILDTLSFLFEKEEGKESGNYFLSSRLSKNIIGNIKSPAGIITGPADGITNLKTGEYIRAETCIYNYHKTQKEIHLDRLIATLWRPIAQNPASDDLRVPFDDGLVFHHSLAMAGIDPALKQAVFLFYSGCRRFIASRFTNASSGSNSASKDIFLQFMRLVNGLAGNDVTKHEAVRQSYLIDTMVAIDEFAKQQKDLEKRTKKYK